MVGLSRSRFYQLIGSAFPFPVYDLATRRPLYPVELQEACRKVRQTNQGINGKPILFHRRAKEATAPTPKPSKRKAMPDDSRYKDMLAGLRSLGMAGVTTVQVETVLMELGISDLALKDNGEVLRSVFLRLKKRQDTSAPTPTKKPPKEP